MKLIGLLGGMSWESTQTYYQILNKEVRCQLGGLHSARVLLHSVDFAQIEQLQHRGDWDETARILIDAAQGLEKAGAEFLMIGTNTMHKVAEPIEKAVNIPLLHIADATAVALQAAGVEKVGLLGTAFTMEQPFYKERLVQKFGLEVITPTKTDRAMVHQVIYQQLCLGDIQAKSKLQYLSVIEKMVSQGAQAIILGCTEIGLLIQQSDTEIPLFDTTELHAKAAVALALES